MAQDEEYIDPRGECAAEITRLSALVYVPGVWNCPKCKFQLVQSNLNARDGTVTSRNEPGDKCPNCESPLWRLSERTARIEMTDIAEKAFLENRDLRTQLAIKDKALVNCESTLQLCSERIASDSVAMNAIVKAYSAAKGDGKFAAVQVQQEQTDRYVFAAIDAARSDAKQALSPNTTEAKADADQA